MMIYPELAQDCVGTETASWEAAGGYEGWNLGDEADVVDGADSQDGCWEALFMPVLRERL
jgi:hypothetical protein